MGNRRAVPFRQTLGNEVEGHIGYVMEVIAGNVGTQLTVQRRT